MLNLLVLFQNFVWPLATWGVRNTCSNVSQLFLRLTDDLFGVVMQEYLQSLSCLFKILCADLGLGFRQGSKSDMW